MDFEWKNQVNNFDNVVQAMLSLFIIGSLVGWPNIMYFAIDATEKGKGPKKDNNLWASLYFLGFILIGSFFFLNLFIAVIFERFNQVKK